MSEHLYEWNGDDRTLQRYVDEGVMSLVPIEDTLQQIKDAWNERSHVVTETVRIWAPRLAALLDGLTDE